MIERYAIIKLIHWTPFSLTFLARDLPFKEACGIDKEVVLKLVWDPRRGSDEARRHQILNHTGVTSRILTSFVVDSLIIKRRFGTLMQRIKNIGFTPAIGETVTVLVLEKLFGEQAIKIRMGKPASRFEFPVVFRLDGVRLEMVEYLGEKMQAAGAPTRLQFLIGLAEVLSLSHKHHVVHWDLKPENILWEPGHRPWLINFGNLGTFGSPGWQSPAHRACQEGSLPEPCPEADIWAMGQFIQRLGFGQNLKPCQELVGLCKESKIGLREVQNWLEDCYQQAFPKVS